MLRAPFFSSQSLCQEWDHVLPYSVALAHSTMPSIQTEMWWNWLVLVLKSQLCTFLPSATFSNVTLITWNWLWGSVYITRIMPKYILDYTIKSINFLFLLKLFWVGSPSFEIQRDQPKKSCSTSSASPNYLFNLADLLFHILNTQSKVSRGEPSTWIFNVRI